MIALVPAFLGIPNPIDGIGWVVDQVGGIIGGLVGDVASDVFGAFTRGVTAWILDGVVSVATGVFNFFMDATDPNVQADWFVGEGGPYPMLMGLAASLLLICFLAGTIQGLAAGDGGGMVRRLALHLPAAVLGMVVLVAGTQVAVQVTDEASSWCSAASTTTSPRSPTFSATSPISPAPGPAPSSSSWWAS